MNRVNLVGNLGRDPEVRETQYGKKIMSFSIATSERWKDRNGEMQDTTEWHSIVVFAPEIIDAMQTSGLRKGHRVHLEGQLKTRKWTDKEGRERYTTEITVSPYTGLITIDARSENKASMKPTTANKTPAQYKNSTEENDFMKSLNDEFDDEVPF